MKSPYIFRLKILCAISAILIVMTGCEDIFEENITDESFVVITPPQEFTSTSQTISFFWEELEGAEFYRLQIAKPDFDIPIVILVDSAYNSNSVNINLEPGNYEWRMRGENYTTYTSYVYGNIVVDSALSLNGAIPILLSPGANVFTNQETIEFSWEPLLNTDEYRFELVDLETGLSEFIAIIPETMYTYNELVESNYEWKITGLNEYSVSSVAGRTISIDRTPPPAILSSNPPNNFDTEDTLITFSWTIPADIGSVQSSRGFELEISDQLDFSDLLIGTPLETNIDSLSFELEEGTFYWRIHTFDAAGNDSIFSASKTITIDP